MHILFDGWSIDNRLMGHDVDLLINGDGVMYLLIIDILHIYQANDIFMILLLTIIDMVYIDW